MHITLSYCRRLFVATTIRLVELLLYRVLRWA